MSARSAPQILSIKGDCTFLIIGLCNFSGNSLSEIFSFFITASRSFFYQKIYKPLKQDLFDVHRISIFLAILNALSRNILSEAVLLVKSLKSP